MKKPNFFIIGAPKCGTTSLAAWLAQHPAVFMSEPKELDFFNTDVRQAYRDSLQRYESFFHDANETHVAVGEASTGYLRSRVAIRSIIEYSPSARFIVCVRNPVEMAVSWHGQAVFEAWETEKDFETAWKLQDMRRDGRRIPRRCYEPSNLFYGEVCKLGEQIERLLQQLSRDKLLVLTVDELRSNPGAVYDRILRFLNLPNDNRTEFPTLNVARTVPTWLSVVTRRVSDLKRKFGVQVGFGVVNGLNRRLARRQKTSISDAMRKELVEYFRDDVRRLERLLDQDFSHWLGLEAMTTRSAP